MIDTYGLNLNKPPDPMQVKGLAIFTPQQGGIANVRAYCLQNFSHSDPFVLVVSDLSIRTLCGRSRFYLVRGDNVKRLEAGACICGTCAKLTTPGETGLDRVGHTVIEYCYKCRTVIELVSDLAPGHIFQRHNATKRSLWNIHTHFDNVA